jgi:hypothetical protein
MSVGIAEVITMETSVTIYMTVVQMKLVRLAVFFSSTATEDNHENEPVPKPRIEADTS